MSIVECTARSQEMTWTERADQAAQKAESEAIWKGSVGRTDGPDFCDSTDSKDVLKML